MIRIRQTGLCATLAIAATALVATGTSALAQDREQIKLGFIGPLSGGNALQGLGARNGFLLAIEQANEATIHTRWRGSCWTMPRNPRPASRPRSSW